MRRYVQSEEREVLQLIRRVLKPGDRARFVEFLPQTKHLGGRECGVLGADVKPGRWVVVLKSGAMKSVRAEYLVVYGPVQAGDAVGVVASEAAQKRVLLEEQKEAKQRAQDELLKDLEA